MKALLWTPKYVLLFGLAAVVLLACNLTGSLSEQEAGDDPNLTLSPTIVIETASPAAPTPSLPATEPLPSTTTPVPSPTEIQAQPTLTPTTGPLCTVLTNLNLRSGPGTAYRPPLTSLVTGTELTPIGFNPVGVPGGPWVQVRVLGQDLTGWVSAGEQFVSCNIELSTLSQVAVDPPSPPSPPRLADSAPDGSFPEEWVWELDFNPIYLLRFKVYDETIGTTGDGDGIGEVAFEVIDPAGEVVLQRTERTAAFCIFGGGEPNCNSWIIEDSFYKWQVGGPAAVSGDYQVNVLAQSADGLSFGNWRMTVNMQFP
jgi:hypothetical protein